MLELKKNKQRKTFSDINVTPFVDVMLVLLIIFMVTAPLLDQGIEINLPVAKGGKLKKEETPIVLQLKKDKNIYINSQQIPSKGLETRIKLLFNKREDKNIFIKADKSLPYGFVAQIISRVKGAGISKIGLVTLPPE